MKKLPSVFRNNLTKKSDNNEIVYCSYDRNEKTEGNVLQKINTIFNSKNYIYKADVIIKLKDKSINKTIIGKNKTHLITKDNELISIQDILDIKKSSK